MRNHPARSARILSAGLSTSALFGLITVFTMNQANADLKNQNELLLQQSASNQLQVTQPATGDSAQVSTKSNQSPSQQPAAVSTVAPSELTSNQVQPAVPATNQDSNQNSAAQPAAPNVVPPTPAPASNATTGGSK